MHARTQTRCPLRLRALAALAAAWLGCAAAAPSETAPGPAPETPAAPTLWRAEGPDGSGGSYTLMGSVHLGNPKLLELGPRVDLSFARADELVVEVDLSTLDQDESLRLVKRYGMVEPPDTVRSRLSDETYTMLKDYLAKRGEPMAPFLQLSPWLLAETIAVMELRDMGLDPEHGVDRALVMRAAGTKPIVGLESMDEQLSLLSELPPSLQDTMLRDVIQRVDELRSDAEGMIDAWHQGDDEVLESIVFRSLVEDPALGEFYDRVVFHRSEQMAARLAELAQDGKNRFVVVGAGHMVGEHGLPALLAARGFSVSEIQ